MNKLLELFINDYHKQPPSDLYKLNLHHYCATEKVFMATLNKKQKDEYLKLEFLAGGLNCIQLNDFGMFLLKQIKEIGGYQL